MDPAAPATPDPAAPTPARAGLPRMTRLLLLAVGIVVLDQLVKLAVKLNMSYHEEHNLVGSLLRLHFLENEGAAFGFTLTDLFGWSEDLAKVVLTLFSLVLVGFIAYYLWSIRHVRTSLPWWIALILGGAFGNIIDRVFYGLWFAEINNYEGGLFYGRVVDMFYLYFWQGWVPEWVPVIGGSFRTFDFAIFNIADAAISVGIVVVLLFQRRLFAEEAPRTTAAPSEPPASTSTPEPDSPAA